MFESMESIFRSKIFWITAILALLYLYFKKVVYSFWERRGVVHAKPTLVFGNIEGGFFLRKITIGNVVKKCYEKFKKYPYNGLYILHKPVLMINDPELIKQILIKDFSNFCDRGLYYNPEIDPLNSHLFFMTGNKWRTLRAKLSPTLTSGKLKHMFPLVTEIANEMISVTNESLTKSDVLELKDLMARYTTDTIFSLAFGFNCNSLKYPDSEFRYFGNLAIENNPLRLALGLFAPSILEKFRIPFMDTKVTTFFIKLFQDMVDKRRLEKGNRKDFLNLLIDLIDHEQIIEKGSENSVTNVPYAEIAKKLEVLDAAAQAFVFLIAGFETSSSIVTHCLYELSLNPDIQETLHAEVDNLLQSPGGFNYESLGQLEYLDMVLNEAMRIHPSVPILNRITINDYKIPNSDLVIPKDVGILISVSGLHRDPDIYPNPDKFDPTRFNKENTAARHPCAYLAFGEGPRICIGKRLGLLQSKVALFSLLSHYSFSVCNKTPIPNYYSTKSLLQTPKDGIYLRVTKRKVS